MPFIRIQESSLLPGIAPVELYYRECGNGVPLVFLHGGWGYSIYPFDRQITALGARCRILIPDRSGYGRSAQLGTLPVDFHRRAATETWHFLDALAIERCVLWGHSDGAVIAALMGLDRPRRVLGVVLEAFHFFRAKEGSRDFFQAMIREPECFGERVCRILAREHGEDYWRTLLRNGGRVWLELIEGADRPDADLYDGKLAQLTIPMCVIHGRQDPRTEPGELAAIRAQLSNASIHVLVDAGHSPHSHRTAAIECNRIVAAFLHTAIEPQVLPLAGQEECRRP